MDFSDLVETVEDPAARSPDKAFDGEWGSVCLDEALRRLEETLKGLGAKVE